MRNTEKQFSSDFCIQCISTTFSNIQVWEEKLAFARRKYAKIRKGANLSTVS